jgi:NAD(P)-dependent dehydrogenase (short-subunit alcohol dehydrogenase family)
MRCGALSALDVVISSAGVNRHPMAAMTEAGCDTVMNVNLKGKFHVCQAAGKAMLAMGIAGSIINVSSISSLIMNRRRHVAVYCASKAGVNGLTRAFAAEWAPYVWVKAIAPGVFPYHFE